MASRSGPKTTLAEVYSHPTGNVDGISHAAIKDYVPFKSGLTPLYANPNASFNELVELEALEDYQTWRFHAFTTAQLTGLESLAFEEPEQQPMNLDGLPIHYMFRRENWLNPNPLHHGPWPLGLGRDGFWEVSNPIVWEIMQPSLRIATIVLSNAQTWPWFDALLLGDRVRIPQADLPLHKRASVCYRYMRRPAADANSDSSLRQVQEGFMKVGNQIDFDIVCGAAEPHTSLPRTSKYHGMTLYRNDWRRTKCNINFYDIEPLLNPNLHSVERLICQFDLASTILHELSHALEGEVNSGVRNGTRPEGYFENECLAEVGFSMENALWGGVARRLNVATNAEGLPYAGLRMTPWNTCEHIGVTDSVFPVLLNKPSNWTYECSYPVPVEFFRSVHDPAFWASYVRMHGYKGTQMGPLTSGAIWSQDTGWQEDYDEAPSPGEDPKIDDSMTDAQKAAINFEIKRNHAVRRVQAAMRQSITEREYRRDILEDARDAGTPNPRVSRGGIPYVEPRFTPALSDSRFDLIAQYLFVHRQELAFDSLHFEIAEHQLYWYIVREGFTSLTPTEWRAFLQICNFENALFEWTEYLSPPGPTQGTVTRINDKWPYLETRDKVSPEVRDNSPGAIRLRALIPIFIQKMQYIGEGFCPGIFVGDQYDFDKSVILKTLRYEMATDRTWRGNDITEFEFDECVRYMESINEQWTFGPKGIIRKTENGW